MAAPNLVKQRIRQYLWHLSSHEVPHVGKSKHCVRGVNKCGVMTLPAYGAALLKNSRRGI